MKKLLFLNTVILLSIINVLSQDDSISNKVKVVNKRGIEIQPKKGDWCVSIDASPFLTYLGNIVKISDNENNAPVISLSATYPGSVYLRYFKEDNKALRLIVRFGVTNTTELDGNGTVDVATYKYKTRAFNFGFIGGIEKTRDIKSRIRGYYGFQGGVSFVPYYGLSYYNSSEYVIGNTKYTDKDNDNNNYKETGGNTISLVGGCLLGIEYFIAPKLSLGAEIYLNADIGIRTERKYIPGFGSEIIVDMGGTHAGISNYTSGSILLHFYF